VLTSKSAEKAIRAVQERDPLWNDVTFIYVGEDKPCHQNRLIARAQSWLDCFRWNRQALEFARCLDGEVGFDVIHHVTYASWRVASPLWKVGKPFVWGPLGGAASFPGKMFSILSRTAFLFELIRNFSNRIGRFDPAVKKCLQASTVVVATNAETSRFLRALSPVQREIDQCWLTYFTDDQFARYTSAGESKCMDSSPLLLFAGGNLQGSKGLAIAFMALDLAKRRGLKFHFLVAGNGPEFAHLMALANRLGIRDNVTAGQVFSGTAYATELGRSHICLLPSFREALGLTLVEGMLARCVPVVADASATAEIVTDACGFKIPLASPRLMAGALADALLRLDGDRPLLESMGKLAQQRALELFTEDRYRQNISSLYREAVSRHRLAPAPFPG